jgi:opacity protein-like surface antigen
MRLAARFIAALALAFVMMPAMYADDGVKSQPDPNNGDSSAAVVAPAIPAKPELSAAKEPPLRTSTSGQSESGAFASSPVPAVRSWDEPGDYTPKVEWFLGYSFWRATPTALENRMGYLHGGSTSVAYNFNRYVGLVADFGGYDNSRVTLFTPTTKATFNSDGSAYTYLFGPRVSFRGHERFTPFFQVLLGGAHASSVRVSGCTGLHASWF